jgi:bacillopeptidase F (M6 metalloprotease family)
MLILASLVVRPRQDPDYISLVRVDALEQPNGVDRHVVAIHAGLGDEAFAGVVRTYLVTEAHRCVHLCGEYSVSGLAHKVGRGTSGSVVYGAYAVQYKAVRHPPRCAKTP